LFGSSHCVNGDHALEALLAIEAEYIPIVDARVHRDGRNVEDHDRPGVVRGEQLQLSLAFSQGELRLA
jgi:hypothetical protein